MPEAFGRMNVSMAVHTDADRMVERIEAWLDEQQAAGKTVEYDFWPGDLPRRVRRVVYGGELRVRIDGEERVVTREVALTL